MKYKEKTRGILVIFFILIFILVIFKLPINDNLKDNFKSYNFYASRKCNIYKIENDTLLGCFSNGQKRISYFELNRIKESDWLPKVKWDLEVLGLSDADIELWYIHDSNKNLILSGETNLFKTGIRS